MAGDRISEAYDGKINESAQKKSRLRIDWICSKVKGNSVLDIGCSQGITEVLLARKGKEVLGIDNDFDSIEYAQNYISKESEGIKNKVAYVCDDFLGYNFGEKKFDTIILGEVLEHVFQPELFLEKVTTILQENGCVIVSVPFGINPHPDHKRTYYFLELYKQISKNFLVEDVKFFMGKWIAMVATNKINANKPGVALNEEILSRIESAFYQIDNEKLQIINEVKKERNNAREVSKKLEEKTKKLEEKINKLEQQNKKIQEQNGKYSDKIIENKKIISDIKEKNITFTNDIMKERKKLEKELELEKKKINTFKVECKKWKVKYNILSTSKLGRLQTKYWNLKNKIRKTTNEKKNNSKKIIKNSIQSVSQSDFEKSTDKSFINEIKEYINKIPESNGGRYYNPHNYKIGIIADEFLYKSFKDSAEFMFITPNNWQEVLEQIDFLLVVSAWRGLNDEWSGIAQEKSKKRELLYEIIQKCKDNNRKVVFYSKEDPPNYDRYVNIAKRCDYIFTTAAEVVDDYKRDCNNDNVHVLCFSINPLYHNPVGFRNPYKKDGVIFSGSWMKKYPERLKDMKMLFDGVVDGGKSLKIIDRNYSLNDEKYRYPEEYWPLISPSIDHKTLQKVHKLYNWSLNINTVTKSMTMFANRGYELQACGNLLISNYSVGVNNKLPMIFTVNNKEEVSSILNAYTSEELYRRQIDSIRSVMSNETSFDRVGELLKTIDLKPEENKRRIVVVVEKISESVEEMFDKQSYLYKDLVELNDFNEQVLINSDMITFFDETMDYDMFYLEDMANGFKYTKSDYITKDSYYDGKNLISGKEHDYVDIMKNKYCTLFWSEAFTVEQLKEFKGEVELENGYSIDHFNFNLKKIKREEKNELKISVIVPVYNNWRQLLGKSFVSLQRSTIFNNMEVILVDDGSNDGMTDKLVKYLEKNYSNVKSFLFEDGGSGTASRPRNKGVELATTEYITYLDPDNEAICDGYYKLYEEIKNSKYDVVVGDMFKFTTEIKNAGYYKNFHKKYGADIVTSENMKKYMEKTKLSPMSIQAMLIKKSLIVESGISQPIGAAGQDSLFCWELLMNAKCVKAINIPIHIYYAAVEGSTVNSIGKRFFEKYYLIENPRRKALEKYGIIDLYMKLRYNSYYCNWILKKLSMAKIEDREESVKIAYKMHQIYEDIYLNNDKLINKFIEKCKAEKYSEAFEIINSNI